MVNLHTTFSGSIAEHYDRCLGPFQFGPFGRELAALVPSDPGGDVLETACGTGLVTRTLRDRLARTRRLTASDLSKPMLEYARGSLAGIDGIDWREADATNLPFANAEFAAVVCALGFMFVPDKPRAFAEARRVLRDDGRLCFSVWDRIDRNPAAQTFADVIEGLFPGDSEIQFRLPWEMHDEGSLRKLLADARFGAVRIENKRLTLQGDPRTIATGQVLGTPRGALLEKKGLPLQEAIDRVTAAFEKLGGPGGFRTHGQVLLVEARAA